ncbi:hypothetical protein ACHAAC_12905 [Aeromicrobium sp. CF4.19]|uniref:hypothetical protein n=1 Tax=Aeromicrobium sp. CF4.19 TaxID=3373082 RepID=UPI003EE60C44
MEMRSGLKSIGVTAAVLALMVSATYAAPNEPGGPGGSSSAGPLGVLKPPPEVSAESPAAKQYLEFDRDLSDASEAFSLVADQIGAYGEGRGLAGLITDQKNNQITVYWKGEAPADLRDRFAKSPYGVKIDLREGARYSKVEARDAAHRLGSHPDATKWGITTTAAQPGGGGIEVNVKKSADGLSQALRQRMADVARLDESALRFNEVEVGVEFLSSRVNDFSPWKGGIRTYNVGSSQTNACSTGFAATIGGAGRLLSAYHCNKKNSPVDNGDRRIAPGSNVHERPTIDALGIDPTASPATAGKVYVGAWNSGQYRGVKNWARNYIGDSVCGSGATSGTNCGTITNDSVMVPGLSGAFYVAVRSGGNRMVASGDSGGAVYDTYSNGGKEARGVILAGDTSYTSCGTHNPDVSPSCYSTLIYVPISVALNIFGYTLELG